MCTTKGIGQTEPLNWTADNELYELSLVVTKGLREMRYIIQYWNMNYVIVWLNNYCINITQELAIYVMCVSRLNI